MFRIGEFSKICGLSIDTLYHYEKMNLLSPEHIDQFTGYRYYDAKQLVTVNKIIALKESGFKLEEIADLLNNKPTMLSLIKLLEEKTLILEEELNKELSKLERLRTNIFLIKNGGIPLMNEITIKRVEPILVTSIRKSFHKSQFDEELTNMWGEVNEYIESKNGKRTIPCMMLYHIGWNEMDVSNFLEVEVAEPITKAFGGNERVNVYELPAENQIASIVHKGPFSTIGNTFEALFIWIKENGYKKNGPIREIYHKGEWATSDQEEYITELQIPIF